MISYPLSCLLHLQLVVKQINEYVTNEAMFLKHPVPSFMINAYFNQSLKTSSYIFFKLFNQRMLHIFIVTFLVHDNDSSLTLSILPPFQTPRPLLLLPSNSVDHCFRSCFIPKEKCAVKS